MQEAEADLPAIQDQVQKRARTLSPYRMRLLEAIGQALVATDKDGIINYWNKGAEKLFGLSASQIMGHRVEEFLSPGISEKQASDILNEISNGGSLSFEMKVNSFDGQEVPVIATIHPLIKKDGKFNGAVTVFTDLTEQKYLEAELAGYVEAISTSKERIEKLVDQIRVLSSLTRYNVRNTLAVYNGYIYLLRKKISDNQEALKILDMMHESSRDLMSVINFETVYHQIDKDALSFVDVDGLFVEATKLISGINNVKIDCKVKGLEVLANPLFRQVIYNLINCTLKYAGGKAQVRFYYKTDGNDLSLIYEDNVKEITTQSRNHFFEKDIAKANENNLYLAMCIIDSFGWSIEENGKPNKGLRFTIKIPANKFRINE